MVLSADCVAYSFGNFHRKFLRGKKLAIACPKLDRNLDVYVEKIKTLIEKAEINTLTVITMEVPCCRRLLEIAKEGANKASRKVPLKHIVISIKGEAIKEEWV